MEANFAVVFQGSPMDAEVVKEILADHGIRAYLRNELMGTIAPWHITPGGFAPVEVEVSSADKEKALQLIDDFNKGNR